MNKAQPKNVKRSVRDMYKRRLQWLRQAVEQYEIAASDRIQHGGKIRDRDEIDAILKEPDLLKQHLPEVPGLDEETNRRLCELFHIDYVPMDKRN